MTKDSESGGNIFDADNQIHCRDTGAVGQTPLQGFGIRQEYFVQVDKLTAVEIEEMVVMAGIGVVEGGRPFHGNGPQQPVLAEQGEGVVDRRLGNPVSGMTDLIMQLLGGHVLITGEKHLGDLSTLRGR